MELVLFFHSRCSNCASVIHIMEQEMVRANEMKSENNKQKEALEQEVRKTERERERRLMGVTFLVFGGFALFVYPQKRPNFPFGAWTIVHGHQKI